MTNAPHYYREHEVPVWVLFEVAKSRCSMYEQRLCFQFNEKRRRFRQAYAHPSILLATAADSQASECQQGKRGRGGLGDETIHLRYCQNTRIN